MGPNLLDTPKSIHDHNMAYHLRPWKSWWYISAIMKWFSISK